MQPKRCHTRCEHSVRHHGQALIGLLVVVAILIGLYMMFLGPRQGEDGESRPSVAKQSIDRASNVAGDSNISQIQMAISMFRSDNGRPPASLDELKKSSYAKGFPPEMWVDPVTKRPLAYDPATGRVSSPATASAPSASNAPAPAGTGATAPGGIKIPDMQPKMPADSEP
jgi:hypothetical protein